MIPGMVERDSRAYALRRDQELARERHAGESGTPAVGFSVRRLRRQIRLEPPSPNLSPLASVRQRLCRDRRASDASHPAIPLPAMTRASRPTLLSLALRRFGPRQP
jgi:hypothetical protein